MRKGPSLDPADRQLAAHVEDHPPDYADFHGRIPEGQYGIGEMETWDRGTWEPIGDPEAAMRKGRPAISCCTDRRPLQGRRR